MDEDDLPIRRRNRPSLVCDPCKRRKVKCDKGRPCTSCTKNNFPHKCVYAPNWTVDKKSGTKVMKPSPSSSLAPNDHARSAREPIGKIVPNAISLDDGAASSGSGVGGNPNEMILVNKKDLYALKNRLYKLEEGLNTKYSKKGSSHSKDVDNSPLACSPGARPSGVTSFKDVAVYDSSDEEDYVDADSILNHKGLFLASFKEEIITINAGSGGTKVYNMVIHDQKFLKHGFSGHFDISSTFNGLSFDRYMENANDTVYSDHASDSVSGSNISSSSSNSAKLSSEVSPQSSTGSSIYEKPIPDPTKNTSTNLAVSQSGHFVGVNPYASPDDAINFFDNYSSIDNNETSRRTNYGPFTWATILRRDTALRILKKYNTNQKNSQNQPQSGNESESNDNSNDQIDSAESRETKEAQLSFEKKQLESEGVVDLLLYKKSNEPQLEVPEKNRYGMGTIGTVQPTASYSRFDHSQQKQENSSKANHTRVKLNRTAPPQLKVSDTTIVLGITFKLDSEMKLIADIEAILPTQKTIWLLIRRFFLFLYPHMPFVDEMEFRSEMTRILGYERYDEHRIQKLNITKRMDFAYLGLLLIFLKLSYLTIASKHSIYRHDGAYMSDGEYLLEHPIDANVIEVAKRCINQFQIMRKFNFVVFQVTYYLRLYHIYAPEEGDGADGGDSQVFNGMLVQMAHSIGLHRDPDNFKDELKPDNERENNLGRKIWLHLVIGDFVNSFTFGTPLNTKPEYYDTKYPYHLPKVNDNVNDTMLESAVIELMSNCQLLLKGPMNNILKIALNVTKKTKLSKFTRYLNFFEIYCSKIFGKLAEYVKPLEVDNEFFKISKYLRCKILLSTKSFFISMYYHLFLFYEKKNNLELTYFYLKKMAAISIGEIIPYIFPMIYDIYAFFDDAADVFILPTLLQMIHRTSEVNIAAIVRINFCIFAMKTDPQHSYKLWNDPEYKKYFLKTVQMVEIMEKCARLCIAGLSDLSDRYYYAWGAARSQTFLLKVVTSDDFYAKSMAEYRKDIMALPLAQVEELIEIYGPPLKQAETIFNKNCPNRVEELFRKKKSHSQDNSSIPNVTGSNNFPQEDNPIVPPLFASSINSLAGPAISNVPSLRYSNSNAAKVPPPPDNSYIAGLPGTPSMIRSFSNVITSEFEELNFSNSAEVDNLWLQMLSSRTEIPVAATRESTIETGYDLAFHMNSAVSSFGNEGSTAPNSQSNSQNSQNSQSSQSSQSKLRVPSFMVESIDANNPSSNNDIKIKTINNNNNSQNNNLRSFNINFPDSFYGNLGVEENFNFEDSSHFNFFSDLPLDKIFNNTNSNSQQR